MECWTSKFDSFVFGRQRFALCRLEFYHTWSLYYWAIRFGLVCESYFWYYAPYSFFGCEISGQFLCFNWFVKKGFRSSLRAGLFNDRSRRKMSDSHGARSIFTGDGDGTTIYNHAGLIPRDIGHRYTNVKRPRIDSGSFNSSEVFSSAGIVQGGVFHSPITSTIAASLPTQSESTFSRKSTPNQFSFLFIDLGLISLYNFPWILHRL